MFMETNVKIKVEINTDLFMRAGSEIREWRQLKFQSESKGGRRFRGAAVEADSLQEIKEPKIDGH